MKHINPFEHPNNVSIFRTRYIRIRNILFRVRSRDYNTIIRLRRHQRVSPLLHEAANCEQ